MKIQFALPNTPQCRVVYVRDGQNYSRIMRTPLDIEDIRITMAQSGVSTSQVLRIEAIEPLAPIQRTHPALRQLGQYAKASDN